MWICSQDIQSLRDWKFDMTESDDERLTSKGRQTLRNLGWRMRKRLSQIINSTKLSQINVQVTNKNRTRQSAHEFFAGMFDDTPIEQRPLVKVNLKDDYLLKYPDICAKFEQVCL